MVWQDGHSSKTRPPSFRAPSSDFVLPAAVASLVDTVVGLDDANRYVSHRIGPAPGSTPNALPGTAEPADLRTIYGAAGATHPVTAMPLLGAGETVAILGTGYAPADADVKNFITKYSLPTNQAGQYVRVFLGGDNRDPSALANDEYGENVLDIDMVLSMAPMANVVHVLTAANAGGLFADGIAFVVNQVPQAHAATVSYGTCERVAAYEVLQLNTMFLQAQSQGQAWFFASGDDGTDDCQDASPSAVLSVEWPASSPYAFGVGGTSISSGQEIAWSLGGGGQSELFPKPSWQEGIGPYPDDGVREVPDVSALAGDPGVATVFGTSVYPSMGTSAATPIWAGVWALIDEARGNVGMADYHERMYTLGKLGTGAFNDVTAGTNGSSADTPGYPALPGYDLATGWGTPNVKLLVGGLP
jgi:kumamolisin